MKTILKSLILFVTLIACYSAYAGELPEWKEEPPLQLNGHQLRYGSMDYGDNCQGYSSIGVIYLHGTSPNTTVNEGGAFYVAWASRNGVLLPLTQWFRNICARVVAPDSGLKYSIINKIKDTKAWNANNSGADGDLERRQIIQLMDKMVREQGVTELYLMGFSSGSLMTHNIAQDLINHPGGANEKVRNAIKGLVMADGHSANQVSALDARYVGVDEDWWKNGFVTDVAEIGGVPNDNPALTDPHVACSSTDKLVSTTAIARERGIYIDGSEEITGLVGNKKWDIPTLIVSSIRDEWISPCLKTHFANKMHERGIDMGPSFGHSIRIQYVDSKHDGSIWHIGFPSIQRALLDAHNTP